LKMTQKLVIAGMPGSGKSTFIIALRHLLISQEVTTQLRAPRLSAAEKHLNQLEQRWLACEKLKRSKQSEEEWVSFFVTKDNDSTEAQIVLPDFSGEAFRRPAATGNCSSETARMLAELDGMLVFTNADRGADDVRLEPLQNVLVDADPNADVDVSNARGGSEGTISNSDEVTNRPGSESALPFDPINMPEEPLLVELLQILNRRPRVPTKRSLAVIVSAWDTVEDTGLSPTQWLQQHRPMLCIRPRIPAVADAPDFAETSVLSGRVVGGGADAWRGGRR
jgi:energy-coupling factor transporter ATP-binding protein EcfA2